MHGRIGVLLILGIIRKLTHRRSVYDKLERNDIVLSKEEMEMLSRIQKHQFPETMYDPYEVGEIMGFIYSLLLNGSLARLKLLH